MSKIVDVSVSSSHYFSQLVISIELPNGKKHAVSFQMPKTTEELAKSFQIAIDALGNWASEQE